MKWILGIFLGAFVQISLNEVRAAIPASKVAQPKFMVGASNQSGGISGSGFSLMDLKVSANRQARMERLIFDVGDMDGHALKGFPGYFNVELSKDSKKVVIDFSQMPLSQLDLKTVKARLKNSLNVQDVKMNSDPSDNSLSVILELKKPAKMKVFQVPGQKQTSKVVVDLLS